MYAWIQSHEVLLWWLGSASLLVFLGSLIVIPILVARIPADYFTRAKVPKDSFIYRHPLLLLAGLLVKNAFGVMFLLAGIAMLVLPGQGILTMLIGLSLMNFPGKQKLEIWLIRQPAVYKAINWIRARAHQAPLALPEEEKAGDIPPTPLS